MGTRVFLTEKESFAQPIILLSGYFVLEASMFFFVFEMQYVKLKTECDNVEVYKKRRNRVRVIKYTVIGLLLFVQMPLGCTAMAFSYSKYKEDYRSLIIGCIIINRLCYVTLGGYVYTLFARLFVFFLRKKLDLQKKLKNRNPLTIKQKFIIIWIILIFLWKASIILIAITWSTYYQLSWDRSDTDRIIQIVFQKIYSSLGDFLETVTMIYFFYFQGMKRQKMFRMQNKPQLNEPLNQLESPKYDTENRQLIQ
jgi:uncharacterized membrane protein